MVEVGSSNLPSPTKQLLYAESESPWRFASKIPAYIAGFFVLGSIPEQDLDSSLGD